MARPSFRGRLVSRSLRWLFLATLFLLTFSAGSLASTVEPLAAHVDPRVELVSIVFRLTGVDSDYNKSFIKQYASDIDVYFSPFKNHPAVLLAKKLADRDDFDVSAPMQIAVRIGPPPALEPLRPFTNNFPGDGFDKETALLFLEQLREFYRDTHFENFLSGHQELCRLAEDRFNAVLQQIDLNWFSSFYGEKQESGYNLILGLNNGGGNYGAQFSLDDGREERFSIMGSWTSDSSGNPTFSDSTYLDVVIHEFNHSFVNPAFDRHKADFVSAQKVFEQMAGQMGGLGYGNSSEMVYESLVRVNVMVYLASKGRTPAEIQAKIRDEQKKGFLWMGELYSLMHQYTSQRSRYPTFDSFMPVVAQFYRDLLPRLAEMKADFYQKYVHVVSIQPFANHARDVDAGLREMIIKFDKPLLTSGYSLSYGPDGKDHFPLADAPPDFLAGGQTIKLHLALKPGWHYSFTLTDESFASPDGFPLEPYTVDFDTKP